MDEYSNGYVVYLESSKCYTNLDEGKANIDSVKGLIKNLYDVIAQASGTIFEQMEKDLNNIMNDCESIYESIGNIMEKLHRNGERFQSHLENHQKSIGMIFSEYSYTVTGADQPYKHEIQEKIKEVKASSNGIYIFCDVIDTVSGVLTNGAWNFKGYISRDVIDSKVHLIQL